jgi:hypothetical protein
MEGSPTWRKASEKSSSETGMALRLIVFDCAQNYRDKQPE